MNHRIRASWQRAVAALMLIVWGAACSVPVGDNYDDFLKAIREMDPGSGRLARREESHWRAL
jgi:hypothetical protein